MVRNTSGFEEANFHRSAVASIRDIDIAAQLVHLPTLEPRERLVVEARRDNPVMSWREIGDLLGMSKYAAASLWRRANLRAAL